MAVALGMLTIAGSAMLADSAQAQYGGYGGGGYGGGYDRPRRDYDEDDRRRGPRDDFDGPRRGGGGGGMQARGSFVQTCRDIEQDGAYLSASCRMRGGGYRRSQIDTRSCRSIGNRDGRLICE